jgi:AcrR family transcriptional regulator
MSGPMSRRRNKLAPDPDVRCAILDAASRSLHDHGVRGLTIAAVLERAQLSTRAFYRNFDSKDQLIAAVFLEMARGETQRLRKRMANTASPVEAVAAWIDGRFDLVSDENTEFRLRHLSLQDRSKAFSAPELVSSAHSAILEPLIEQLQRGLELGMFGDIVPATAAKSIDGVVSAGVQPPRASRHWDRFEVRERALRFCLRGLGVAPETIERVARHHAQSSSPSMRQADESLGDSYHDPHGRAVPGCR